MSSRLTLLRTSRAYRSSVEATTSTGFAWEIIDLGLPSKMGSLCLSAAYTDAKSIVIFHRSVGSLRHKCAA